MSRSATAASTYLLLIAMTACARTPMLYPVPGIPVPSPPPAPLEEVDLHVEGVGRVSAWHWDGGTTVAAEGPVLVFFHGNGENLATLHLSGTLSAFIELGAPYLAVDYPGYGRSAGKPSEDVNVESALAALDWMRGRHPGRPLVVAGWSLGAAVAIPAAVRSGVDGLIAMSAWTTLEAIGRAHFPSWMVSMFARESYDSLDAAPRVAVPALVVHGTRDQIIPVDNGRQIAAALPDARWVEVHDAGHNDLLGRRQVWEAMKSFLEEF
jgi:pimeloyl-ACP methyl ester carboxylesterase